jgi:hypothetical protein
MGRLVVLTLLAAGAVMDYAGALQFEHFPLTSGTFAQTDSHIIDALYISSDNFPLIQGI